MEHLFLLSDCDFLCVKLLIFLLFLGFGGFELYVFEVSQSLNEIYHLKIITDFPVPRFFREFNLWCKKVQLMVCEIQLMMEPIAALHFYASRLEYNVLQNSYNHRAINLLRFSSYASEKAFLNFNPNFQQS